MTDPRRRHVWTKCFASTVSLALLGHIDQDLLKIEEKLDRKRTDRELGRLEEQMESLAGRLDTSASW